MAISTFCVKVSGGGNSPERKDHIVKEGFSTKGDDHGYELFSAQKS